MIPKVLLGDGEECVCSTAVGIHTSEGGDSVEAAQQGHCQRRINMGRPACASNLWQAVNSLSYAHTHAHTVIQGHRVKDHGETTACCVDVVVTCD